MCRIVLQGRSVMSRVFVTDHAYLCVVNTHEGLTTKGASDPGDLSAVGQRAAGSQRSWRALKVHGCANASSASSLAGGQLDIPLP